MRELPRGTYWLWLVAGICFVALSIKGLADGRITAVSSELFLSSALERADQPQAFCVLELIYFFGGAVLVGAAVARFRMTRSASRESYTGRPGPSAVARMESEARARASAAPPAATKAGAPPIAARGSRAAAASTERPTHAGVPDLFPSARAVAALRWRFRLIAGLIAVVAGVALMGWAAWFMHLDPLMNFLFIAIFGCGGAMLALAGLGYIFTGRP